MLWSICLKANAIMVYRLKNTELFITLCLPTSHNPTCNVIYERRNACFNAQILRYRLETLPLSTHLHILSPPFFYKEKQAWC